MTAKPKMFRHPKDREALAKWFEQNITENLESVALYTPGGMADALLSAFPSLGGKAMVTEEEIAGVLYATVFGGTSDPTLDENMQAICRSQARAIIALLGRIPVSLRN